MKSGNRSTIIAFTLLFTCAGALSAEFPNARIPTVASAAIPAASPTAAEALKPLRKRFLLSHSSSVYEYPDKASAAIAHVRRKTRISVTGIQGDWLQIRLSSGKVGFILSSAAE
jgi:hypothetical protein